MDNFIIFSIIFSLLCVTYFVIQKIKLIQLINQSLGFASPDKKFLKAFNKNSQNYYKNIMPFKYYNNIQKIMLGHLIGTLIIFIIGLLISEKIAFAIALSFFYCILYILFLKSLKNKETQNINQKLPDFLDLLCLFLKAGISMPQTIEKILSFFEQSSPEFTNFLKEILNELKKGESFVTAFDLSAQKLPQTKLKTLSIYFVQAETFGTPLTQIFQILAQDMRSDAMVLIEEKAQKLGVLLSLPLILCFLPALLLLIFAPALLKLAETLQQIL
ncbi:MAG: type II secretion system F family protein [Alphaproteobacteria bacterium]|nr:type II secretion system F family protein [Alphaproteobacteria bacterium]